MSAYRFRVSATSAECDEDLAHGTVIAHDLASAYQSALQVAGGLLGSRLLDRRYGNKPSLITVYLAPLDHAGVDRQIDDLFGENSQRGKVLLDPAQDERGNVFEGKESE